MECIQCGPIRHRKSSYCPFCGRGLQVTPVGSASGRALVSSWPVAPLSDEPALTAVRLGGPVRVPGGEFGVEQPIAEVSGNDEDVLPAVEAMVSEVASSGTQGSNRPVFLGSDPPIRLPGPVERPRILPVWVVVLTVVLLLVVAAGYLFGG